jgi:integrase/recombinase XerD
MKTPELGPWLQRFFREHLLAHRNLSPATIAAYRDTFRLLLPYLKKSRSRSWFSLALDVLTPDSVVRFLDHLERQRGNCIRTRKARLAAIRSFVHYLSDWLA